MLPDEIATKTTVEQDIKEIKAQLAEICKALGINNSTPRNVIELRKEANRILERSNRKLATSGHGSQKNR
jgi:hypothetical protein